MASIKIVRRKNKEGKDGTAPLALRISKNYKTNYCFLGLYVLEKDWDEDLRRLKRTYPNSKKLNNSLRKKLAEANDIAFEMENASSKEIRDKIKKINVNKSFFQIGAERIEDKYKNEVFSVAKAELSILYNLKEYINLDVNADKNVVKEGIKRRRKERISKARKYKNHFQDAVDDFKNDKTLSFHNINESFLAKYKSFCKVYLDQKKRTITNQLIFIRTLFNIALKEEVVDAKYYPFGGEKEKIKIGSGQKIGLVDNEVNKIENLKLERDTSIWHAKNAWLLAFYFAGVRISDAVELKWSDFKNNRLYYQMNKNEKPVSLKVPEKAAKILRLYKKYADVNKGYIFPFLRNANLEDPEDVFVKMRNATSLLNKYLKRIAGMCGIEKSLSNHIARHSFGNIAGDRIHPLMLQKLYRHSDLKTTLDYQANFIHKEADQALDKVINF